MEKASKKIGEVEVELTDGTKRTLATLTKDEFPKVKLDGKKNDKGHFTSLSLKRGIVKDDGKEYIERRLFKYGNSAMYVHDLPIPVLEETFNKIPFVNRLDKYAKALRIDSDHDQVTGEGKPVEEKIIDKAMKLGLPASAIEAMKAALKKQGFGK